MDKPRQQSPVDGEDGKLKEHLGVWQEFCEIFKAKIAIVWPFCQGLYIVDMKCITLQEH